jgi:hypothetical protein
MGREGEERGKMGPRQLLPKAEMEASASPVGMDSIPLAGASDGKPVKRRCISSACMPCRKRKSKVSASSSGLRCIWAEDGDACHMTLGVLFWGLADMLVYSVTAINRLVPLVEMSITRDAIMISMPIIEEKGRSNEIFLN